MLFVYRRQGLSLPWGLLLFGIVVESVWCRWWDKLLSLVQKTCSHFYSDADQQIECLNIHVRQGLKSLMTFSFITKCSKAILIQLLEYILCYVPKCKLNGTCKCIKPQTLNVSLWLSQVGIKAQNVSHGHESLCFWSPLVQGWSWTGFSIQCEFEWPDYMCFNLQKSSVYQCMALMRYWRNLTAQWCEHAKQKLLRKAHETSIISKYSYM